MISKNEIKEISSLLKKKFRKEKKKIIVEGKKLIFEALEANYECSIIICTNNFAHDFPRFLELSKFKEIRKEIIKEIELKKISDIENPQGVIAVFNIPPVKKKYISNKIIALENISDPGNLGTIIRNCDWFGFSNIILSDNCAEIYNPKVIRASAGSLFRLQINEEIEFYDKLKYYSDEGYYVICTDIDGSDLYKFNVPEKYIVVFCNEANGPSKELLSICNNKITIPKYGKAESLNVASASAVVLSVLSK